MNSSRRAFAVVEILIVLSMIAFLLTMLLPAVQQARVAVRFLDSTSRSKTVDVPHFETTEEKSPVHARSYHVDRILLTSSSPERNSRSHIHW